MGEMKSIPSAGEKRSGRRSALVLVSLYILFPCNINVALARRRRRKEGNGPSRLTTGPGGEKGRLNFVRRRGGGVEKEGIVGVVVVWEFYFLRRRNAQGRKRKTDKQQKKHALAAGIRVYPFLSLFFFWSSPFEKALSPEETPFLRNRQGSPD